jgi:hypothetical protein
MAPCRVVIMAEVDGDASNTVDLSSGTDRHVELAFRAASGR